MNYNRDKNLTDKENLDKLERKFSRLDKKYVELREKHAIMAIKYEQYKAIKDSFYWKATKPLRIVSGFFIKVIKTIILSFKLIIKGLKSLKKIGPKKTYSIFKDRLFPTRSDISYMKKNYPSEALINEQKQIKFDKDITFSIIVPLFNTPEKYLREMITSVLNQTYGKLELCLADASEDTNKNVEAVCKEYIQEDNRVKYKKLEKNEGIPKNTNAALGMATGDFIALLDHDDLLSPIALFECMREIEKGADFIYSDEMIFEGKLMNVKLFHFKPDFSPDTLRSYNLINHLCVYSMDLYKEVGGFLDEYNGSQDYDMVLRLTEKAKKIAHIPKPLYFWRRHPLSVASDVSAKPYCLTASKKAIAAHLDRIGLNGFVYDSTRLLNYKIDYEIEGDPKVSIIIPNKDHISDLSFCINSLITNATYENYEIIIVENNSEKDETFEYYDKIVKSEKNIKVVYYEEKEFNYPAINEFGIKHATGEYILLLNNDVEVITDDFIEEMLMFAQRDDVGAVGGILYYPDGTIQHAGIIVGLGGAAGHASRNTLRGDSGYIHRTSVAQNMSAVTGACMMFKKKIWDEVGGMNKDLKVAFNDVDFCLRIREKGYLIVFTPYAELYHYESKSRGMDNTPEKKRRYKAEYTLFQKLWKNIIENGDPYYNPNLTRYKEDFSLK